MIIRNLGVRQGRKVLAAPLAMVGSTSRQATLSTSTTTGTSSPTQPPPPAGGPRIFTKAAKQARIKREAAERDAAIATYHAENQVRAMTKSIGSVVHRRPGYEAILENPPAAADVTLELLMANQTHIGHNTSLWNPSNSRFIYGTRQGVHIISLEETAAHLRRAAKIVEAVTHAGGLVLFVGTRKGQMEVVTAAATLAGGCHLFTKWTPGAITNRDVILASGELKVVDALDRQLDGFGKHLRERRPLAPDLVVCLNPLENFTLLRECGQKNIPTIGVIDTDADPTWVTYTIPANDDSLRSVGTIAAVLGRAGQDGQRKRLADAKQGDVMWQTPTDVRNYMRIESKKYAATKASSKTSGKEAELLASEDVAKLGEETVEEQGVEGNSGEQKPGV